ncbi:MAG: hypothetical protein LBI78_05860 [Campylobacteraceae bacterium]|nr:hypothetical protein [Campylobacteraceae bacterium]
MQKLINGCSSKDEIEKMCDIISDEFLLNGITEDFEANAYGKELENILDIINRDRL